MSYVLVIESDAALRRVIADLLQQQQPYRVASETNSDDGLARVMEEEPTVIVMAEELPPVDGEELLPLLRRISRAAIIVEGPGGEDAVVRALLQGADVYMPRPFNLRELRARVLALFRRAQGESSPLQQALALLTRYAPAGANLPSLTPTESRLLSCLACQPGRVVGHKEIMARTWGRPVDSGLLRFYIWRLRRRLENSLPFRLLAHKGVGYRLVQATSQH